MVRLFFCISIFFHCLCNSFDFILFLEISNFELLFIYHFCRFEMSKCRSLISDCIETKRRTREKKNGINRETLWLVRKKKTGNAGHLLNVRVNARMHREAQAEDCIGATEETSSCDASLYSLVAYRVLHIGAQLKQKGGSNGVTWSGNEKRHGNWGLGFNRRVERVLISHARRQRLLAIVRDIMNTTECPYSAPFSLWGGGTYT